MNKIIAQTSSSGKSLKCLSRGDLSKAKFIVITMLTLVIATMVLSTAKAAQPVNSATNLGAISIEEGFSNLVKTVRPAVVSISVTSEVQEHPKFRGFGQQSPQIQEFLKRYFGDLPEFNTRPEQKSRPQKKQKRQRPRGTGSGFVIDPDGYIVTNYHVIEDADEIQVMFDDGTSKTAVLEGTDKKTDLALLKIDTDKELPYVEFGNSDDADVGDWVIAIGNPFGLGGTATSGIISARGRDIRSGPLDDFIQVDASINRGNSGGPLFNTLGQVIGVNSAIFSPNGGSVGIGFAIPSSMAENVIAQLRKTGDVKRGYLGVQIQSVDEDLADSLGLDKPQGALVVDVVEDSPADKAGIKSGDVIVSYDNKPIKKMRNLPKFVALTKQGEKVDVKIWRDDGYKTLQAKVGNPDQQDVDVNASSNQFGFVLSELNDDIAREFQLDPETTGVVIVDIDPNGVAAERGLLPGDVVKRVGKTMVETPKDVVDSIQASQKKDKKSVLFLIERGQTPRFVALPFEDEQN